jgi:hypothetical protein
MKLALALPALCLALCPALAHADGDIALDAALTKKVIRYLSAQDKAFNGGMHQGIVSYSAELECSNPSGNSDSSTMRCFLRPTVGFSQFTKAPLSFPRDLSTEMKAQLEKNDMSYLITNGFAVLGAKVRCDDMAGTGEGKDRLPNSCRISSLQ